MSSSRCGRRLGGVAPVPLARVPVRELLSSVGAAGNLVSDAHLAALSIEHGTDLCSSDADFSCFPAVRRVDGLR